MNQICYDSETGEVIPLTPEEEEAARRRILAAVERDTLPFHMADESSREKLIGVYGEYDDTPAPAPATKATAEAALPPGLVIYREWWEAVRLLSVAQKAAVFQGLFHLIDPTVPFPKFNRQGETCFAMLRSRALFDRSKWYAIREKRIEAGKRGAKRRWEKRNGEEDDTDDKC